MIIKSKQKGQQRKRRKPLPLYFARGKKGREIESKKGKKK